MSSIFNHVYISVFSEVDTFWIQGEDYYYGKERTLIKGPYFEHFIMRFCCILYILLLLE